MGKTKQADAFSPLRDQFKELKKENKELKEKSKECDKKSKEFEKQKKEADKKVKELEKKIKTLENQKSAESKDINNELSEYAQIAIKGSRGPLKPNDFEKFLINDVFGKRNKSAMTVIRKYSESIDEVKKQLLWLHDNVETYMMHREEQKKLDDRLVKTIKKFDKTIEEEQEKSKYNGQSPMNRNSEDFNSERSMRKRKLPNDDESCSSQDSQDSRVRHLTSDFNKRVKINSSSEGSIESTSDAEVEESVELNSQHTINQREFRD